MGLFGGGGRDFDWGRAAVGFFNPEAGMAMRKRADQREITEEMRRKQDAAFQVLIQQGVPEGQARLMAQNLEKLSESQIDNWTEMNKPRQFGSEGGSMARPDGKGGYSTSYTAPAWQNGSLFGDTQGGNAMPQILREAEKVVPIEAGGGVVGTMPYSGGTRPIVSPNDGSGTFGQPASTQGGGAPPTETGGLPISFEAVKQYLGQTRQGPEALPEFLRRNAYIVKVSSPEEARQLPAGTRIMTPDGREGVVPGGAGPGQQGFR